MYSPKRKNRSSKPGAVFEGIISCEESMKIKGEFRGDIKFANSVVIGPNGSMTGDSNAEEVIVLGKVTGKIDAGALEIKSTGIITGELLIETLITRAVGNHEGEMRNEEPRTKKPGRQRPGTRHPPGGGTLVSVSAAACLPGTEHRGRNRYPRARSELQFQ